LRLLGFFGRLSNSSVAPHREIRLIFEELSDWRGPVVEPAQTGKLETLIQIGERELFLAMPISSACLDA